MNLTYTFLFPLLLCLGLAVAILLVWLLKLKQTLTHTREKHRQLQDELLQRSQKLSSSNDQLYEEIAKHEITEELLHNTRAYIQDIINSMPSILIGINHQYRITHWNKAATETSGLDYKQALGQDLFQLEADLSLDKNIVDRAIRRQKTQQREKQTTSNIGKPQYLSITVYPLRFSENEGAVIRIDDISARVSMEQMMMHNDKLNSLGELATGIAHEINNPVSAILQSAQNIQRRLSPDLEKNINTAVELGVRLDEVNSYLESRKIPEIVDEIKQAGERTSSIISNMLAFSRNRTQVTDDVDLRKIIEQSATMAKQGISMKTRCKQVISFHYRFADKVPLVECSPTEIQQVLLNLINNAIQSFDEDSEQPDIRISLGFTPQWAEIDVEDNGKGMDEWTRKHLFDPFFTTKEAGQGTGLGLSICYYIITERHQGLITVKSAPDKGTRFTISLPRN